MMIAPAVASAVRTMMLTQARMLARAGRLAEAAALLTDSSGELAKDVAVLDLLARIHAQQGRLAEADRCWARVQERDPGNTAAAAGRVRIAEIQVRAARMVTGRAAVRGLIARTGGTLACSAVLALVLGLWLEQRGEPPVASRPPFAGAPATVSPAARDVLTGLPVDVPGVAVRRQPSEVEVTFDHRLFTHGAALSPEGRRVVAALGERLRPYGDRLQIGVIGHTDRRSVRLGGEYASNVELGTLRATVVRELLRTEAEMPTFRFSVATLAGQLTPFEDPADPRNRTVTPAHLPGVDDFLTGQPAVPRPDGRWPVAGSAADELKVGGGDHGSDQ